MHISPFRCLCLPFSFLSYLYFYFLAFDLQVLQAMGYPTGFDSDLDPMSSDEKSDSEGKSETSSHTSNNPTHSSDSSNTLEVENEKCVSTNESTRLVQMLFF